MFRAASHISLKNSIIESVSADFILLFCRVTPATSCSPFCYLCVSMSAQCYNHKCLMLFGTLITNNLDTLYM